MKRVFTTALRNTVPVMTGYVVLSFGFGLMMRTAGYSIFLAVAMSLFVYAGSLQYVAVGLMTGGASLLTTALTTLFVNARHLFYGISMLRPYGNAKKHKPYLIFALTDETYSLVCTPPATIAPDQRETYAFVVSLLNQSYWVFGTFLGAVAGSFLSFNSTGIDFALTALFLTTFLEQWLSASRHAPALIGLGVSLVCLIFFGAENFLIPSMFLIALLLCFVHEEEPHHD